MDHKMTLEERREAFINGVAELERKFGITVIAIGQVVQINGEQVPMDAKLAVSEISTWTEPVVKAD